ncbi:hypothetical protein [Klebsiella pneumoniae]|uniref:hypothetical protein n=1 Tax=Klebsiella pneumoniae TaxID=573 RepID=UPI0029E81635|nr:hypothetical protein [Klebsiella pneumoniae]
MDFDIYNFPHQFTAGPKRLSRRKKVRSRNGLQRCTRLQASGLFPRRHFALIRGATSDIHHFPVSLQTYINANLTEHKHDAPSAETLEKLVMFHLPPSLWTL